MKNQKGITLIALIVTIIVLLILAGVAIATLTGDNSVLRQTNAAKVSTIEGTSKEEVSLACAAMRLAIAEAQAADNTYNAKNNAVKICDELIRVLNADTTLNGTYTKVSADASADTEQIKIKYTGNDYSQATNNTSAKIDYSISLTQSTLEVTSQGTALSPSSTGTVIKPSDIKQ